MFNQKARKTLNDWKHTKSLLIAESTTAMNNFMTEQSFLWILQYNIRKSLRIQESFLIDKEVHEFNIVTIQKQDRQRDLSVRDADYEPSASYACQKSWTISSTSTEQ